MSHELISSGGMAGYSDNPIVEIEKPIAWWKPIIVITGESEDEIIEGRRRRLEAVDMKWRGFVNTAEFPFALQGGPSARTGIIEIRPNLDSAGNLIWVATQPDSTFIISYWYIGYFWGPNSAQTGSGGTVQNEYFLDIPPGMAPYREFIDSLNLGWSFNPIYMDESLISVRFGNPPRFSGNSLSYRPTGMGQDPTSSIQPWAVEHLFAPLPISIWRDLGPIFTGDPTTVFGDEICIEATMQMMQSIRLQPWDGFKEPLPPAPPEVWIDADPNLVKIGDFTTVTWGSNNADHCEIDHNIGVVSLQGEKQFIPTETVTLTITATGYGSTAQASVTITVWAEPPSVTIIADPETIVRGSLSTLSWTSENAISCEIDQNIGLVELAGSCIVSPSETTRYQITARGILLDYATDTATVTVIDPPDPPRPTSRIRMFRHGHITGSGY